MPKKSNRDRLVASGVTTLYEQGFSTAGVRDITAAAGVPQGSFTNHFRSKDAFGIAVLERYFNDVIQGVVSRTLQDGSRVPIVRLRAYFEAIFELLSGVGWRHGCLIGNMSLEASEHSDAIRRCLVDLFERWTAPFVDAVRSAQQAGEVHGCLDAEEVATFLLCAWQGAMLRMKVDRGPAPLDAFLHVTFATILAAPDDQSRRSHAAA